MGRVAGRSSAVPYPPQKNTKTKETVVMRSGSTQFHCRRGRTNKDLTCTRIRALGQRRDKEIPKTLRPHLEQLEDSSLGAARDDRSTRVHGAAASIAWARGTRGEDPSPLFHASRPGPRRTPCVKYDSC